MSCWPAARGEMFGPGNAQLPVPNMLMMDRVDPHRELGGANGKGEIIAELDIKPELWFFQCHFPGDPVMPGCLGLDALWQLVGFYLAWIGNPGHGRALGVGRGQVHRPGAAERHQGHLPHRHEAGHHAASWCSASATAWSRSTDAPSTPPRTCGSDSSPRPTASDPNRPHGRERRDKALDMTQIDFYSLEPDSGGDRFLLACRLVERIRAGALRVLIHCPDREEARHLDRLLWTYREDSFLPHGLVGDVDQALTPVLISLDGEPAVRDPGAAEPGAPDPGFHRPFRAGLRGRGSHASGARRGPGAFPCLPGARLRAQSPSHPAVSSRRGISRGGARPRSPTQHACS